MTSLRFRLLGGLAATLLTLPFAVLAAPGALGAAPPSAGFTSAVPSPTNIDAVRRELAESTDAMVQAVAALRDAEATLPAARRAAESSRAGLVEALRREDAAATVRGQAQVRLIGSERAAEEAAVEAAARQRQIGVLAREAYQSGPTVAWMALLDTPSLPDAYARLAALDVVSQAESGAVADLTTLAARYEERNRSLTAARDRFSAAHAALEAEVAKRADAEEQARATAAALDAVVSERGAALTAATAAVAADSAQYAELAREASTSQRTLRVRALQENPGSTGSLVGQPGTLSRPVQGPVSSPFGMRVHPITGVYKLHTGTDLRSPCGTPIQAAADGDVLSVGFNRAYGNRTVIGHGVVAGVSLSTTYSHQSALAVTAGEHVLRGQVIGFVGTTGFSTGCHLHFEVLVDGTFVDPMSWL